MSVQTLQKEKCHPMKLLNLELAIYHFEKSLNTPADRAFVVTGGKTCTCTKSLFPREGLNPGVFYQTNVSMDLNSTTCSSVSIFRTRFQPEDTPWALSNRLRRNVLRAEQQLCGLWLPVGFKGAETRGDFFFFLLAIWEEVTRD